MKNNRHKTILINGDFFCRRLSGIERYASEITRQLDNFCQKDEIAIIIPANTPTIPEYKNIKTIRHKKNIHSHLFWQMITLQWFLITHRKYIVLEFGNTCLPFAPGIVFLHDIYCEFFPEDFITFRDKIIMIYNRLQYRLIVLLAKKIITVSEYSQNEISKTFGVDKSKIFVIYSSAGHINGIEADNFVFDNFPVLKNNPFYFLLGSLSKRKNIKWVIEYAAKHHDELFAISGTSLPTVKVSELEGVLPENIIMLGYLDDGKIKALMQKCKAFILPSYYEGFGLTPLEALSCGAKIIVAKAASLPEIYGKTAHYIDPYSIDIDLDELLQAPVEKPCALFKKYSYSIAAQKLYAIIQSLGKI